jgi:hypothetical protein
LHPVDDDADQDDDHPDEDQEVGKVLTGLEPDTRRGDAAEEGVFDEIEQETEADDERADPDDPRDRWSITHLVRTSSISIARQYYRYISTGSPSSLS